MLESIENDIALIRLTEDAPGHMTTVNMHQQGAGPVAQCKSAGNNNITLNALFKVGCVF